MPMLPEPLRISADLMHLLYIADEYTDVESAVGAQEISAIVLDALHNPDKPRPAGESIIGEMTRELVCISRACRVYEAVVI